MEKSKCFEKELGYLKDNHLKDCATKLIDSLPDYFFEVAASSTGKYHPEYALGEGGLLRHTKAAVRFANELLQDPCIGDKYIDHEKDLMIIALMVHDGLKHGKEKEKYVKFDHPLAIANHILEQGSEMGFSKEDVEFLQKVVSSHMGPWNTNAYSDVILPVPKTKYENFVHMCDYLASRKCFLLSFDSNNDVVD